MSFRQKKSNLLIPLARLFLSGCLAFTMLNLFACIYRGGLPSVVDETMSAPVHYVPDTYFSYMTEGISIGIYDKNGFNNAYPSQDPIDYLCLGSSHMEAKEVMPNLNLVYDLNVLLNSNGKTGYAYNIGISGEHLPACINRLNHAIMEYQPQKMIVIETAMLDFPQDEIDDALEDTKTSELLHSYSGGIMSMVRKLPYVRLAYIQLIAMRSKIVANGADIESNNLPASFDEAAYAEKMTPLLELAAKNANGLPIIIFYHPGVTICPDGFMSTDSNPDMTRQFRELCEANGIYFLDMSERFLREYEENYTLPYGFANTSVGSGHLNKYGHAMIADELYKLMSGVK